MIEIGAVISLLLWIVGPPIGIVIRVWTPKRFFWFGIIGSIPLLGSVIIQLIIDGRVILIIPVMLIIVPILVSLSHMSAKQIAREPWRRLYHVKLDADHEESEK